MINLINNVGETGAKIKARINDTGDGILIEDLAGGTSAMKVEDAGSTTATDLNIAGTAGSGKTYVDGSFELRIDTNSGETLQSLADRINASGRPVGAAVLYDGGKVDPYRLSITSKQSGTLGELLIDGGDTSLDFTTLVKARDAVVFFGAADSPESIRVISSTHSISGFIPGLTLDLQGADKDPVTVNVTRDLDTIVGSITSS